MYSNCQPTETGSVLRRQKDGSMMEVTCPKAIISYNKHMGSVDWGDQVRGYYSCRTRCRKLYKYIFHVLLDVSITNAFILQKHYCPDKPFQHVKDFRLQLVKELIGDYCSRRRPGRGGGTMRWRHFPPKIPVDESRTGPDKAQERSLHSLLAHQEANSQDLLVLQRVQCVAMSHRRKYQWLFSHLAHSITISMFFSLLLLIKPIYCLLLLYLLLYEIIWLSQLLL